MNISVIQSLLGFKHITQALRNSCSILSCSRRIAATGSPGSYVIEQLPAAMFMNGVEESRADGQLPDASLRKENEIRATSLS
ncbi:hypothetical protein PAMP_004260 [Pampus punctatissimus]